MAPIDNKFAVIPIIRRQINANSNEIGMIMPTIRVVRQLNRNKDTSNMTNNIPSTRLCKTVCVA